MPQVVRIPDTVQRVALVCHLFPMPDQAAYYSMFFPSRRWVETHFHFERARKTGVMRCAGGWVGGVEDVWGRREKRKTKVLQEAHLGQG
jgi:hypothetical protein